MNLFLSYKVERGQTILTKFVFDPAVLRGIMTFLNKSLSARFYHMLVSCPRFTRGEANRKEIAGHSCSRSDSIALTF